LAKLSAFYRRRSNIRLVDPNGAAAARRDSAQLTVDFNDPLEQLRQIELSRG